MAFLWTAFYSHQQLITINEIHLKYNNRDVASKKLMLPNNLKRLTIKIIFEWYAIQVQWVCGYVPISWQNKLLNNKAYNGIHSRSINVIFIVHQVVCGSRKTWKIGRNYRHCRLRGKSRWRDRIGRWTDTDIGNDAIRKRERNNFILIKCSEKLKFFVLLTTGLSLGD